MRNFDGFMRGVNFGNWLCQCRQEQAHYDAHITRADFARVRAWGLDHVRVPFSYKALDAHGYLYLDRAVAWAKAEGLRIVLDMHVAPHYNFDMPGSRESTMFQDTAQQRAFAALWRDIALHFQAEDGGVAFELLNEVTDESPQVWGDIIALAVAAIREVSPTRPIIIGGVMWNKIHTLKYLPAFDDKAIIYTFHPYEPYALTHQGAPWWKEQVAFNRHVAYPAALDDYIDYARFTGEDAAPLTRLDGVMDRRFLERYFQEALDFRRERDAVIYCGEFGCIQAAGSQSRILWHRDMLSLFGRYDIACAAWNYKDNPGRRHFGLVDQEGNALCPEIIRILATRTEKDALACYPFA